MKSNEIRTSFLGYFNGRQHNLVTSAPIVVKNDPTLMFTNAGMNQFKEIFLGQAEPKFQRVANSQKCLRVSGKHNDLEEVGNDTYHHTMFEMLGNWSFGDYFKKEAIEWAWEFLTDVLKIDKTRLYVTVFEGSPEDGLEMDQQAFDEWKKCTDPSKILMGNKKDNFWEMGDTGPCGPCSEIHVDLRDDVEIKNVPGKDLVNAGHPLVVEIWNLVFIQYNRKADKSLEKLPKQHIDTGMGFERLCMVMQGKKSNYDTDIFQDTIREMGKITGHTYGSNEKTDVAMRVVADHLRAVSFSIADGQLPSNNKAGYVIRRILRRAIRYGYSFLGQEEPFIYSLVAVLAHTMGEAYPELLAQQDIIQKVIREEESAFLRTLSNGIRKLEQCIEVAKNTSVSIIPGTVAFELYDTYGFPIDLTQLILREHDMGLDVKTFEQELAKQKDRSRADAKVNAEDWIKLSDGEGSEFVGYRQLKTAVKINQYRKVERKGKTQFHLVFNQTPFYAESGGQVGDMGYIEKDGVKTSILNTIKENNLNISVADKLPENPSGEFLAAVDMEKRKLTECNHSATHLMHFALRKVLGTHVEQKGSLVHPDYLRFDFSHFQKMSDEEIRKVEALVNQMIRENKQLDEKTNVPFEEAKKMGAMALFGEKYDDEVRVIRFGESVELCGGCHVESTGNIGYFKILKESAVAAGIRRIEAVTAEKAEDYIEERMAVYNEIENMFNGVKDLKGSINKVLEENNQLQKQLEGFKKLEISGLKKELHALVEAKKGYQLIAQVISIGAAADMKDLSFQLKNEIENLVLILAAEVDGKANLSVMISDGLVSSLGLNAAQIVKESAKEILGGGGGQPFFATAGGRNTAGLQNAVNKAKDLIRDAIK
jgi:alanyl-tRNA synthetase